MRNPTMTESNNQALTDNQNEQALNSLRYEIESLKFQLKKKEDRIATLDVMLNQIMESLSAERRAFEDLEDKLEGAIDNLRERVPHSDILDFLKVKDRNQVW
jgi:predicted  nucleic acid-binding Zn-ribbon protein